MGKVLITSFDAFGQDSLNASFELMKRLPSQVGEMAITKLQIPTVRFKSFESIKKRCINEKFDYIIALGQAGNTEMIRLEKVAINLDDFRIMDNEGNQPIDEKIIKEGENAYFSDLPYKLMLQKLSAQNIPSEISYSAGTFVCNHVFYNLLHHFKNNVGFVHVPRIKRENVIGLDLDTMVKAIEVIIECIDKHELNQIGGTLD